MENQQQHLETLRDIKQIMERSSKFVSLSGVSGVAAGICALIGAAFAYKAMYVSGIPVSRFYEISESSISLSDFMGGQLLVIGILTFTAAFITAFLFTYIKGKKQGLVLWSASTRRLLLSMLIPMGGGAIFLLKLMEAGVNGYIAPGCLIFYGLALMNASTHTLGEIKYLGWCILLAGIVNLFFIGYGLYFWALGFGVLHIVYGIAMWWKYERKEGGR